MLLRDAYRDVFRNSKPWQDHLKLQLPARSVSALKFPEVLEGQAYHTNTVNYPRYGSVGLIPRLISVLDKPVVNEVNPES